MIFLSFLEHKKLLALALFILPFCGPLHAQKGKKQLPIVLIHGIISDKYAMKPTEEYIEKYMPGTYVKSVSIGLGKVTSFWNMFDQVSWLAHELNEDPSLKNGFIMIAHSQGGLVGRYFLERYNSPQVHTYISWGSPQRGVFGTPGSLDNRFAWLNYAEKMTHKVLYTSLTQRLFSFPGYWCDTLNYNEYLKKCTFLPILNNDIDHPFKNLFKENISKLKNMVLVQSVNDDIIEPVCSCHFGYYTLGSASDTESLFDSDLYKQDRLGLRQLHEKGRLHLKVATCTHVNFQEDEKNFVENTLPYLKVLV